MRTTSHKHRVMRLRGNRKISRSLMVLTAAVTISMPVSQAIPAAAASQASQANVAAAGQPWLNPHQSPEQRTSELLAQMTLAQKLQMVDGTGFAFGSGVDYAGHIQGIPALGIPDLYLADGAVGAGNGSTGVTQFPDGTSDAATWDPARSSRSARPTAPSRPPRATRSRWRRTSTSSAPRTAAAPSRGTARTRTWRRRSPPPTSPACRARA